MQTDIDDFFQLEESLPGDELSWPLNSGTFIPGMIYLIKNASFLMSARNDIWNIIQDAYKPVGGYKGQSSAVDLIHATSAAKIVFTANGEIAALALYSIRLGGMKSLAMAKNFSISGSSAAFDIIVQDDIQDYDGWYWLEASGKVEHIFKKFGGIPVPFAFVPEFFSHSSGRILSHKVLTPVQDEFHYERLLGPRQEPVQKMIFGLKSKDLAKKVCTAVANYPDFAVRKNVEAAVKHLFPNGKSADMVESDGVDYLPKEVFRAHCIAAQLADLHYDDECNEMLPDWLKLAEEAKAAIADYISSKIETDQSRKQMLLQNIKDLNWCLKTMTPIEIFQLKIVS